MCKQYIIIMINLMTRMIIMIIKNSMTMIKDNKIKINWMISNLLRKSKQAKFKLSPTLQILFCPTNLEPLPKFDRPFISLLIMLVIYFIIFNPSHFITILVKNNQLYCYKTYISSIFYWLFRQFQRNESTYKSIVNL